jgi:hypothetical protein
LAVNGNILIGDHLFQHAQWHGHRPPRRRARHSL